MQKLMVIGIMGRAVKYYLCLFWDQINNDTLKSSMSCIFYSDKSSRLCTTDFRLWLVSLLGISDPLPRKEFPDHYSCIFRDIQRRREFWNVRLNHQHTKSTFFSGLWAVFQVPPEEERAVVSYKWK